MLKTKLEIIEETADFYSADTTRRAITIQGYFVRCQYLTPDGKSCAVGRCLIDPAPFVFDNPPVSQIPQSVFLSNLKPDYQQQDIDFWQSLQSFHDTDCYWDEKGLTAAGNAALTALKTAFA